MTIPTTTTGAILFDVVNLSDLIAAVDKSPVPSYIIRGKVAEGDHGMISAEFKAGKTFLATDMGVSVASGTPWLGLEKFTVEAPGPVLLFAGEGGARKITRRVRAICEARGIDPEALPIRVCLRVPHLTDDLAMVFVEDEIATHRPKLVIIDPLYLAASGARGSDLYEMGAHLESIQVACQRYGAALIIVHHWNQTGKGKGAKRMSGAGPEAWGRVLISAAVVSRDTDPHTQASTVVLDLEFQGDEIAESTVRIKRRVWVDDPDDLSSPMHYEVMESQGFKKPTDPAMSNLRPSAVRVLSILDASGSWETVTTIEAALVAGGDKSLAVRTIQDALARLVGADLAVSAGTFGTGGGSWRSARAHSTESGSGNDS